MNQTKLLKYLAVTPEDPCWLKEMKAHIGPVRGEYYDYCDAQPGDAWCACGLNFMLEGKCGIKGTGSAAALSFKTWGTPVKEYKKGAIICFVWPHEAPGHGHVSILNDWNEDEGWVGCIGANQSDSIKRSVYDMDYIVAMRWPEGA